MTYHVCVDPRHRKRVCAGGRIWVKDAKHDTYVLKKDRGSWKTKTEAEKAITEPCEIVVKE